MITFEQILSDSEWKEVLKGKADLFFDVVEANNVHVLFTETGDTPLSTMEGNLVRSFHPEWDFQATAMKAGIQRIWAKGDNTIRGLR